MLKNGNKIFNISSQADFASASLKTFDFQYQNNKVYRNWVDLLKIKPEKVKRIEEIPFLPIELFRSQKLVCGDVSNKTVVFSSSQTGSQIPSKHYVNDILMYEESFLRGFTSFYGKPSKYCILALLPSYLQRQGSSLVYMCKRLIQESTHPLSGFFLDNISELIAGINSLKKTQQKVILIGVSYALMDLCEHSIQLNKNFIVMETGGMKGRRKELLKPELHQYLKDKLGVKTIHSEYGMTELLSQAYSTSDGLFESPPWMKFLIREREDSLNIRTDSKTGGINVIDLANINSCSFIATQDLGRLIKAEGANEKLELMGRYDHSDIRGCNLMMENF